MVDLKYSEGRPVEQSLTTRHPPAPLSRVCLIRDRFLQERVKRTGNILGQMSCEADLLCTTWQTPERALSTPLGPSLEQHKTFSQYGVSSTEEVSLLGTSQSLHSSFCDDSRSNRNGFEDSSVVTRRRRAQLPESWYRTVLLFMIRVRASG